MGYVRGCVCGHTVLSWLVVFIAKIDKCVRIGKTFAGGGVEHTLERTTGWRGSWCRCTDCAFGFWFDGASEILRLQEVRAEQSQTHFYI